MSIGREIAQSATHYRRGGGKCEELSWAAASGKSRGVSGPSTRDGDRPGGIEPARMKTGAAPSGARQLCRTQAARRSDVGPSALRCSEAERHGWRRRAAAIGATRRDRSHMKSSSVDGIELDSGSRRKAGAGSARGWACALSHQRVKAAARAVRAMPSPLASGRDLRIHPRLAAPPSSFPEWIVKRRQYTPCSIHHEEFGLRAPPRKAADVVAENENAKG